MLAASPVRGEESTTRIVATTLCVDGRDRTRIENRTAALP
jgi:hypothetical protein